MPTISQRITRARKMRGLSQERLAERMKVSRGACGHWERGKALPSTEHLTKLATILNVPMEWLATGKGDIDAPHQISEPLSAHYITSMQDDETKKVAELFYRLSKRKRKIILDLLHEL